ncbi:F0F1 ATP synthase subunit epsilon [Candidatus Kinetoplastidibacterium galati]|uniref:ATP synthase epsilon chain n=1 Tax=Candidatus Kinetoplastidibacterium galati TCC219 TaxID=1208921 RepID=M1LXK9_9PROT|nr:F0F1 ATP synthase subunit epsilon [Candidatus Kinetoplastibacterium galatii]AGF48781.1 F-type H+-transporting ATPase subunit epsilon [Candidatus Kinetoplastibacterium galatii TCC219]
MNNTINVNVVSISELLFSGEAKFVLLPAEFGDIGVLPGHVPLISLIRTGMLKIICPDDTEHSIFVAGGILEVQPKEVTVLADTAVMAMELDEEKIIEARKKAEEVLRNNKDRADIASVEMELNMLAVQAKTVRKFGKARIY